MISRRVSSLFAMYIRMRRECDLAAAERGRDYWGIAIYEDVHALRYQVADSVTQRIEIRFRWPDWRQDEFLVRCDQMHRDWGMRARRLLRKISLTKSPSWT